METAPPRPLLLGLDQMEQNQGVRESVADIPVAS